jgi:hypothetical protein
MRHVSDGELHAYLDGALDALPEDRARSIREHVRTCPECRIRLDEEAAIRSRAQELLGLTAAPNVEFPTLEELKEQAQVLSDAGTPEGETAEGVSPSGVHRLFRTVPRRIVVAWAASLVVALGVGWFGRDLGSGPGAALFTDTVGSDRRAAEPLSSTGPVISNERSEEGPPSREGEAVGVGGVRDEIEQGPVVAGAQREAQRQSTDESSRTLAARGLAEVAEGKTETGTVSVATDEIRADRAAEAELGRAQEAPSRVAEQAEAERRDRLAAEGLVIATPVPPEAAAMFSNLEQGSALSIPGLPVLSVQATGASQDEIRIVQALPSGEALELQYIPTLGREADLAEEIQEAQPLQAPELAEPAEPRALVDEFGAPMWNEVVVQLGDRQLTVRGPLATDSLRLLIEPLLRRR